MASLLTQEAKADTSATAHLVGKYLTFALGGEKYGLEILKVQEIIGVFKVTKVPRSPDYVKGVINLRGKIISIVDLRLKLGMPERSYDEKTCFIIANLSHGGQTVAVGVVVDTVLEVVNFEDEQLQLAPDFGQTVENRYIKGMGQFSDNVVILLDIDSTLGDILPLLEEQGEEIHVG